MTIGQKLGGFYLWFIWPSWGISTVLWKPVTTLSQGWTVFSLWARDEFRWYFLLCLACAAAAPLQCNGLFSFLTLSSFLREQQILFQREALKQVKWQPLSGWEARSCGESLQVCETSSWEHWWDVHANMWGLAVSNMTQINTPIYYFSFASTRSCLQRHRRRENMDRSLALSYLLRKGICIFLNSFST